MYYNMSIASEISRIQSAKDDIREAIGAKGVTVPENEHIDTYPNYISQIQQGGGGGQEVPANLESWAYDDWGMVTSATTTAGTGTFGTAFKGDQSLTDVVIKGYTVLDNSCFEGCISLSGVTLPDGLTSLGSDCFKGCSSLTAIKIPNSVTEMETNCFSGCTSLTGITIPSGVRSLPNRCFSNCTSLTGITIPNTIRQVGMYCFSGCTGLASITVESATPPIAYTNTFNRTNDCPIYVPCGTVETYKAASGWTKYASRIFENPKCSETGDTGNTKITYNLQGGTTGSVECDFTERLGNEDISTVLPTMTSCTVGSCAKTISGAFENAPMLSQVTLSEGIETIDRYAFNGCTGLTSITIPESTTTVGGFKGCTSLSSVTLGSKVTDFAADTFSGCTSLTGITIPGGVSGVSQCCFSNCTGLTSVTLEDGMSTIDSNAFYGCSSLTAITIPQSVKAINGSAFESCTSLTGVTFNTTAVSIGDHAFQGCNGLTEITLPATTIGEYVFQSCGQLRTVDIGDGVTSIGNSVFSGCANLSSVTVRAHTPPTLSALAFQGTAKGLTIYVPANSVEQYKTTLGWRDYADKIQAIA